MSPKTKKLLAGALAALVALLLARMLLGGGDQQAPQAPPPAAKAEAAPPPASPQAAAPAAQGAAPAAAQPQAAAPAPAAPAAKPLDPPPANHAAAADIARQHGGGWGGMQLLTYARSLPGSGKPDTEVVVAVGHDAFYREEGGRRFAVDLKLGRVFLVEADKGFRSYPAAAAALVLGDAQSAAHDTFWAKTAFHAADPLGGGDGIRARAEGGEEVYTYRGKEVMRWRGAADPLPEAFSPMLAKAATWFWTGHPVILSDAVYAKRPPARMAVLSPDPGGLQAEVWKLKSSTWCADCAPLPADARPAWGADPGNGFDTAFWPAAEDVVTGKVARPDVGATVARADAALSGGRVLEGWLLAEEAALLDRRECGPGDVSDFCRVRAAAQAAADADVAKLTGLLSDPCGDCTAVLAALGEMRGRAGEGAAALDLLAGTRLRPTQGGEELLAAALRAAPLPQLFLRAGEYEEAKGDHWRAWRAWEVGRALGGDWSAVDRREADARQKWPTFF
jgi:hypothetical protein